MWKWSCTIWFTLCDYHHKSLTKERLRARSCTHWLYYTGYVFLVALAFTVYRHHHRIVVLWPPVAQYSAYSTLGLSSSLLLLRLENLYFVWHARRLKIWNVMMRTLEKCFSGWNYTTIYYFNSCIGQLWLQMLVLLIWGRGINEYKFMQVQQDLEIHSLKIHELADRLCIPGSCPDSLLLPPILCALMKVVLVGVACQLAFAND